MVNIYAYYMQVLLYSLALSPDAITLLVDGRKVVRSVTRKCITCRKYTARPKPQMLGQLPVERITPGSIFNKVGIDYAGPVMIKYGHVRKPKIVKAYICVFVSLSVKAVHLELVTDLTHS